MLVVKVELWPHGDESAAREIGTMTIGNIGGNDVYGDYEVTVAKGRDHGKRTENLRGCDRRRPVWTLVQEALAAVGF